MSMKKTDPKFRRSFERGVLRAAFKSLFWAIITERKKRPEGFKLTELAKAISTSKHEVSRWFNGDPNWTVNTIANVADALDVDVRIEAVDRKSGVVFTPAGAVQTQTQLAHIRRSPSTTLGKTEPAVVTDITVPLPPIALAS